MNIESAIPHRAPFLLVDEVVKIEGRTIHSRKRVDPDDPVFKGHFPGYPVLPGVLVCEALAQTGGILLSRLEPGGLEGRLPVLTRMNNGKFKQPVRPGDVLEMEVTVKEKMTNAYFMQGFARVNGKLAVSLEFACSVIEKERIQ